MKINKLLKKIGYKKRFLNNHIVSDVFNNSNDCISDSIFICIKGQNNDGHDYVDSAIKNGANTIIYQEELDKYYKEINYLRVDDTKKVLALLLKAINKDLTKDMILIGVTGTNGKTTTTSILHSFFDYYKINNIYIGTHFIKYLNVTHKTMNTTPDIKIIYDHLKIAKKNKIKYVVMEVSSIAMTQLRVLGLSFNILGVTNIASDHLDYHKNFDNYRFAKLLTIFNLKANGDLILNKDCKESFEVFNKYHPKKCITYSLEDTNADIYARDINMKIDQMSFRLNNKDLKSKIIGDYNIYNIMCAAGILKALGYNLNHLKWFLKQFDGVKGRTNVIIKKDRNILIDYAHTQIAVENILKLVKKIYFNKITVVMGCGGDRDKTKRKPIGETLSLHANKIILTNDNPRTEDELSIINDIASGVSVPHIIIPNRYDAINEAITNADEDEIICILGKGDEKVQILKDQIIDFNDTDVANEILESINE